MRYAFAVLFALIRAAFRASFWIVAVVVGLLLAAVVVLNVQRINREKGFLEDLAPKAGRWIPVGDVSAFVQEWGPATGPVMVLAHGAGGWSGTWGPAPEILAKAGWRVVAVDLPPFGMTNSTLPAETLDYTRAAQATRLARLFPQLTAGKVTLVAEGFSAGPALETAMRDTSQLRQLVLVAPELGLGPKGEAPLCEPTGTLYDAMANRSLRGVTVSASLTAPYFTSFGLARQVNDSDVLTSDVIAAIRKPFARAGFSSSVGDWLRTYSRANCEKVNSTEPMAVRAWAGQGFPVALIWGAEDKVSPIAQAQTLQQWISQAKLQTIPGVGHLPHLEHPEQFVRAIQAVTFTGAR